MILPVRPSPLLLLIAGIAACGTGGPPEIPDAGGRQVAAVTLLRWPVRGGEPVLYRFPTLEKALWEAKGPFAGALQRVVGADIDQRQAYALDTKDGVWALDLESGRSRSFLTDVAAVETGPSGAVYAVSKDRTFTSVAGRLPAPFPGKLPVVPISLVGTGSDIAYALVPGDSGLVVARQGQEPRREAFPAAGMIHTKWGDLLAAPVDESVLLYEPTAARPLDRLELWGTPAALAFSPSGHRLYVALEGDNELQRFDRYSHTHLGEIDLPAPARDIRVDPLGRFVLLRSAEGDSVWVVDVVKQEFQGSWSAPWRADLPIIAGGRWLLVQEGADVVGYDLFDPEFSISGKIANGAADLWQVLDWAPRAEGRATLEPGDSAIVDAAATERTTVYVQLSSSQNPAWAEELANKLESQGLPASVIRPRRQDEFYRVVLGPYPSRETADSVGTRLGQPYFLYLPEER